MIVKIVKGRGFRGALNYLLAKADGVSGAVIGGNMAGRSARNLAAEFRCVRALKPRLTRAVAHVSISLSPDDGPASDDVWLQISKRFIDGLGFQDCPFIVVRHDDTNHPHIHLLVSRVSLAGEVVSESNDFRRAESIARRIENDFGFRAVASSHSINLLRKQKMAFEKSPEGPAISCSLVAESSGSSEKLRREQLRLIFEPSYEPSIRQILGNSFQSVRKSKRMAFIYTTDGGRITDQGHQIYTHKVPPLDAVDFIIAIALARGWGRISLTGSPEFVLAAMESALANGIAVEPIDDQQSAWLASLIASKNTRQHTGARDTQHAESLLSGLRPALLTSRLAEQRNERICHSQKERFPSHPIRRGSK